MDGNEGEVFAFSEISAFDWYDGVVRGVGYSGDRHYLLTMVAWDPNTIGKRIYVMIELEPAVAAEINRLSCWQDHQDDEAAWARLDLLYQQSVTGYTGPVYCLAGEPKKGQEFLALRVSADCLKELRDYELEQTMEPHAQEFWFNIF